MQVSLRLARLTLDPRDGRAVALLVHPTSARIFPLWMGDSEARSLAQALRPDDARAREDPIAVLHATIDALGGALDRVLLQRVVQGVAHAMIYVDGVRGEVAIPARASLAIALAVAREAPILVEEDLLEQVAARVSEAEARAAPKAGPTAAEPVVQSTAERWNQLLAHIASQREV